MDVWPCLLHSIFCLKVVEMIRMNADRIFNPSYRDAIIKEIQNSTVPKATDLCHPNELISWYYLKIWLPNEASLVCEVDKYIAKH